MEFLSVPTLQEAAAGVDGTTSPSVPLNTNDRHVVRRLRECDFYMEALDIDCSVLTIDGKKKQSQRMQMTVELCGEKKTCVVPPANNNDSSSSEFHFTLVDYFAPTKVTFRIETVSFFAKKHTIAERVYTLKELLSLPTTNFPTSGTVGSNVGRWGDCVRLSLPLAAAALSSIEKGRYKHEKELLHENRQQHLHDNSSGFMTKSIPPAMINTPTSHMSWLAKGDSSFSSSFYFSCLLLAILDCS